MADEQQTNAEQPVNVSEKRTDMLSIEGVHIRLRDWRTTDLEDYARWLMPGQRWYQFDGPYYPEPSAAQVTDILGRKRKQIAADELPTPRTNLAVALRDSDRLLGTCAAYLRHPLLLHLARSHLRDPSILVMEASKNREGHDGAPAARCRS